MTSWKGMGLRFNSAFKIEVDLLDYVKIFVVQLIAMFSISLWLLIDRHNLNVNQSILDILSVFPGPNRVLTYLRTTGDSRFAWAYNVYLSTFFFQFLFLGLAFLLAIMNRAKEDILDDFKHKKAFIFAMAFALFFPTIGLIFSPVYVLDYSRSSISIVTSSTEKVIFDYSIIPPISNFAFFLLLRISGRA
ncbi:hypothetical protein EDF68_11714 [Ochrobactrum sp. BH3]|nr:hypothetical protein EDF68_11714 [Ochrobactrum sp. BH3]